MSRIMEIFEYITELYWWILPKLITFAAVLTIVWMLLSWYDVVSNNIAMDGKPVVDKGDFFVEVMKVAEWFN